MIGRRVERRRAVERGNQLRAVVERHAIAATSDTVNTRAARACRAPRPGSRREGTAPGQTARPRRARCNRLMAGRFAIAALSARRRRIIGNLVKSRHNSSNLGKSWRMTGIAAGLPSFAKICMGVRWQDRHCYVAMRGLLASGSTLGAGLGTARDGRGRRGPRCRAAVEPRADRQRGGSRARAPHVGRTGRAWAGCPDVGGGANPRENGDVSGTKSKRARRSAVQPPTSMADCGWLTGPCKCWPSATAKGRLRH